MKKVKRNFKWYDWIPIVGWVTTNWGSNAQSYRQSVTLLWGLWMLLSAIGIIILIGMLLEM